MIPYLSKRVFINLPGTPLVLAVLPIFVTVESKLLLLGKFCDQTDFECYLFKYYFPEKKSCYMDTNQTKYTLTLHYLLVKR